MKRPTIIIEACPEYDVDRIEALAAAALERLDLRPWGRTLVKPNCVMSGPYFPHAHTRPEFLEGVLRALRGRAAGPLDEFAVGERSGITVPTRQAFQGAGYYPVLRRQGAVAHHFEENLQVEIPMYHQGRLRDAMFFPEPIAKADFFVNLPKFKAHPWTTVTFSLKNYIGIQDDRHRLIDHDHKLDEKIADLQYAIQPQFIAIDAITAGEGRMLTPVPFDLGLVIMGDNQVAFDAVCCHIIGIDPLTVPHIRLAHQRGFGPIHLDQIDIVGSVSLEAAQARASGFRVGLIRVEDYFRDTAITAYAGPPPSGTEDDYCWGGCPGALEEAIELLRVMFPDTDERMKPMHIVFGDYTGEITAQPGEKVIFIGDCAAFHGQINGKTVQIESIYRDRSTLDPRSAKHDDIFAKMGKVAVEMYKTRGEDVVRVAGCPVSVAEQLLTLVQVGHLRNPYFKVENAVPFVSAYVSWRGRTVLKRLMGQPYQQPGPVARGAARPAQNLPPEGARTDLET